MLTQKLLTQKLQTQTNHSAPVSVRCEVQIKKKIPQNKF